MTAAANSWRGILADIDGLAFGEVFKFEICINENLTHFYALSKRGGDLTDDDWSWAQVAERARALRVGESLVFRMANNTAQTDGDEDLPSVVLRLTLQAILESECPDVDKV